MKIELLDQIQEIEQTHWWYVGRRKIVFDWLLRTLADYSNPLVLDVGCGTGFNIEQLHAYGYSDVVGLDISAEALSFGRSRTLVNLICGDGTYPPVRHESFEVIIALDLIEHLDDDAQTLRKIARRLRPNGALIIFVPAFNFLWGLQDEVSHHRRRYTAGELRQVLEWAGLNVTKLTYVNTFLFPLILAGRMALRLFGYDRIQVTSENDLHPDWSNSLLQAIFAAERPLLRYMNFSFGVSILCVAKKSGAGP